MQQEIFVFASALCTGMILGFIYDLFRMKRKALKTRALLVGIEDILFWIIAAFLVFTAAYISNRGEIRPYFFLAMLLGISIYLWLFSHWVIQILTFAVKAVIWPFAMLIRVLRPPLKWILSLIGKGAQKAGTKLQKCRFRAGLRFRSIRNIMRKI